MTTKGRNSTDARAAIRVPPRLATWLLLSLGSGPFAEALAGDLSEEYQRGHSRHWYWRQVTVALFLARTRFLRLTAWSVADRLVAAFALIALGLGTLTWANVVKSDADLLRQHVSPSARAHESPVQVRP